METDDLCLGLKKSDWPTKINNHCRVESRHEKYFKRRCNWNPCLCLKSYHKIFIFNWIKSFFENISTSFLKTCVQIIGRMACVPNPRCQWWKSLRPRDPSSQNRSSREDSCFPRWCGWTRHGRAALVLTVLKKTKLTSGVFLFQPFLLISGMKGENLDI